MYARAPAIRYCFIYGTLIIKMCLNNHIVALNMRGTRALTPTLQKIGTIVMMALKVIVV